MKNSVSSHLSTADMVVCNALTKVLVLVIIGSYRYKYNKHTVNI